MRTPSSSNFLSSGICYDMAHREMAPILGHEVPLRDVVHHSAQYLIRGDRHDRAPPLGGGVTVLYSRAKEMFCQGCWPRRYVVGPALQASIASDSSCIDRVACPCTSHLSVPPSDASDGQTSSLSDRFVHLCNHSVQRERGATATNQSPPLSVSSVRASKSEAMTWRGSGRDGRSAAARDSSEDESGDHRGRPEERAPQPPASEGNMWSTDQFRAYLLRRFEVRGFLVHSQATASDVTCGMSHADSIPSTRTRRYCSRRVRRVLCSEWASLPHGDPC